MDHHRNNETLNELSKHYTDTKWANATGKTVPIGLCDIYGAARKPQLVNNAKSVKHNETKSSRARTAWINTEIDILAYVCTVYTDMCVYLLPVSVHWEPRSSNIPATMSTPSTQI